MQRKTMTADAKYRIAIDRCDLCFGRGYRPEVRKSGRGLYLRTCRRCGGRGFVPAGTKQRKIRHAEAS